MADRDVRERDILVAGNEYAYVQDLTKGDIVLYVGPTKISLSNTERLVELREGRFQTVRGEEAGNAGVHAFVSATNAQYIVLENPPKDPAAKCVKGSNSAVELLTGRRVVVPGPASFPLWPGQRARVVDGHQLRDDQFLVVRVYDVADGAPGPIGTERIVRGADVSFYVPRTGLEVVPLPSGKGYVRQALRLRAGLGLHVRVIKPFLASDADQVPPGAYAAGQDLFLHDREGFFFPTEALEVVGEVTAIPVGEGEGLYVREVATGKISTVVGPCSWLADPTKTELVHRALDPETAKLYGTMTPAHGHAIAIQVPPSFAVMVAARTRREIVRGPVTRLLAWDESLELLKLSTGKPKRDDELLTTAFLQVTGNKVSDIVRVRTSDHVELELTLSYRLSFVAREGQPERWFQVKNYVALLCDHLASILRAATRAISIESFHAGGTELLRSAILGEKRADGKRAGKLFEENDLWVYDLEVLEAKILDEEVKTLLGQAQRAAIAAGLQRREDERRLAGERLREEVEQQIHEVKRATVQQLAQLDAVKREAAHAQARGGAALQAIGIIEVAKAKAEALAIESTAKAEADGRIAEQDRARLAAQVAAFQQQMAALQPELIATLKSLGDKALAAELTKNLAPLAILGGESVAEVAVRLLASLPVGMTNIQGVLPAAKKG